MMNRIFPLTSHVDDARSVAAYTTRTGTTRSAAESAGDAEETLQPDTSLASKEVFLTLLVAQIKNQNPLNPADGTEFLSQLAQFSELEQLISIREGVQSMAGAATVDTPGNTA